MSGSTFIFRFRELSSKLLKDAASRMIEKYISFCFFTDTIHKFSTLSVITLRRLKMSRDLDGPSKTDHGFIL